MQTYECTEECKKARAERERLVAEFDAKYPNCCHICDGAGSLEGYDSVPYGSTYVSMPSSDICYACVGEGKCPLCGQETIDEDGSVCSSCGWNYDTNKILRPPEYECDCWYTNGDVNF